MKRSKVVAIATIFLVLLGVALATTNTAFKYKDQSKEITVELHNKKEKLDTTKKKYNDLVQENKKLTEENKKLKDQENQIEKSAANANKENELLERQVNQE